MYAWSKCTMFACHRGNIIKINVKAKQIVLIKIKSLVMRFRDTCKSLQHSNMVYYSNMIWFVHSKFDFIEWNDVFNVWTYVLHRLYYFKT